jgi:HEAT repeat protein
MDFEKRWLRIEQGLAEEQERIDAAADAGSEERWQDRDRLRHLLADPAEMVRYFALQSLAIDLGDLEPDVEEACWRLLDHDPSGDVRSMAATCLGKFLYRRPSLASFRRLVRALKDRDYDSRARGGIYDALFCAARRPPAEWPNAFGPAKVFEERDVDWAKVAELEDRVRALVGAS